MGPTGFDWSAAQVSRSLQACIQAQTVSTFHQAFEADLEVLCAISKVDLEHAQKEEVKRQLSVLTGVATEQVVEVSGKTGTGDLLQAIIQRVPPPPGSSTLPFKALLFDAKYDSRRGMVLYVAVQDIFLAKDIRSFRVGETVFAEGGEKTGEPFPGFRPAQPMVYAGIFPEAVGDGEKLETAMQRLLLTDASVEAKRDISPVLGAGFRLGGSQEPLVTATIVCPRELTSNVQQLCVEPLDNSGERVMMTWRLPLAEVITDFFDRLQERAAGVIGTRSYREREREHPHFATCQALSHGFASFDYQPAGYQKVDLVKVLVRLNGDDVDALSFFALRDRASEVSRRYLERLQNLIPAQLFDIAIQAVVGGKVVAKVRIKPLRRERWLNSQAAGEAEGGEATTQRDLQDGTPRGLSRLLSCCCREVVFASTEQDLSEGYLPGVQSNHLLVAFRSCEGSPVKQSMPEAAGWI
eukprot:g18337.t1